MCYHQWVLSYAYKLCIVLSVLYHHVYLYHPKVMECCWAALVKRVEAAKDLDQVIDAHDQFLEKVTAQCLLDTQSQVNKLTSSMLYTEGRSFLEGSLCCRI